MPAVDLVYDPGCPNVAEARSQLLRAFAAAGLAARWQEWQGEDPDAPPRVRGYGSPAILVDGVDVSGAAPVAGLRCCRLYDSEAGPPQGVPALDVVVSALQRSAQAGAPAEERPHGHWRTSAAVVPAIGVAFVPKIACPACWPAYAGFLSSFGLGFLVETTYLLPLTAAFLAIAVGALAFRARRRRGHAPFALGIVASALVLTGKFVFDSDPAMYAGLAILIAASIWNSWPRRRAELCSACVPAPSTHQP